MDSNIEYRIYSTYKKPHLVNTKKLDNMVDVVKEIENVIYKEDAHYIVVQYDKELNQDNPFVWIFSIDDFLKLKSMYEPKEKKLKR